MKTQTYLVTGAAGFVGSRLARALLDRGNARVVGLDNFNEFYPRAHKQRHIADLVADANFTMVEADLRDADKLKSLLAEHRPHAVAHLATMAAVRYSIQHPLIYGEVNVQGTMNLLDAARQHGIQPALSITDPRTGCAVPRRGNRTRIVPPARREPIGACRRGVTLRPWPSPSPKPVPAPP